MLRQVFQQGAISWPALFLAGVPMLFCFPALTHADGGFVAPELIYEPAQKALIIYDSASLRGQAAEFGWIIPVPSLPGLDTVDNQLFFECSRLTQPVYRQRGNLWGCDDRTDMVAQPDANGGRDDDIVIIDEQVIGVFQTMIVSATSVVTLTDSLTAWGYLHTQNEDQVTAALQFYLDKSWYFVLLRIDPEGELGNDPYLDYYSGGIDPIRLTFSTPELVYPMRISVISLDYMAQVLLYVCSDHRLTFPGAIT